MLIEKIQLVGGPLDGYEFKVDDVDDKHPLCEFLRDHQYGTAIYRRQVNGWHRMVRLAVLMAGRVIDGRMYYAGELRHAKRKARAKRIQ